jgi:hypothetical protein
MLKLYLKYYRRKSQSGMRDWARRAWAAPAPTKVKKRVLQRYCVPAGTWVETGTYLGETASFLARKTANRNVISLEPSPELYAFATKKWKHISNLKINNYSSEQGFEQTVSQLSGVINIWLDGHNSGDVTFQGEQISPVKLELEVIGKYLPNFREVSIFIDDVRLFNGSDGYLSISQLVKFADENNLNWRIEHDIFIATSRI